MIGDRKPNPIDLLKDMIGARSEVIERGSWRWLLHVAERTAFGTISVVFLVLHVARLGEGKYRLGLLLVAGLIAAALFIFRFVIPRFEGERAASVAALGLGFIGTSLIFALFVGDVPSAHLIFLPLIMVAALLTELRRAGIMAALSIAAYIGLSGWFYNFPSAIASFLNGTIFALTALVSGVLSQELRLHYRRELSEHQMVMTMGHRLGAVVGAVEEAIVFSDRQDIVRMLNRRATDLFGFEIEAHVGEPVAQLHRLIARQTEDPEGFMEGFQDLLDNPDLELRFQVEQLIPERRILEGLSRPARDERRRLVGRIEVYVDITEAVRRAAEAERLLEEARKTAETYQRALLPNNVPKLPRVTLVAHYIPAAGRKAVCGDFYDFVTLEDGRMGLAMGDVCGAGPVAVSDAALTRYTLGSVANYEQDPGSLMRRTNEQIFRRVSMDRFVRLFVGVLDPERAILEYANAGHVRPILYHSATGEVEWLGDRGLPLGVFPGSDYKTGKVSLEPGDTLFLYTDGVTEAPRSGNPLGQGRLSDLVRDYGVGTPGELVQAVRRAVDAWVDHDLQDDIAMVGLQIVPDSAMAEPMRELVIPNDVARIRDVRLFVGEFLADLRAPVEIASEFILAVGEAAGNAVKYGRREEGRSEIRVRCVLEGTDVAVTIVDEGPGFDINSKSGEEPPDPLASGGRGLFLMHQLSDEVVFESSPSGTSVMLRRQTFDEPPLPTVGSEKRDD
ncbi:MAG: SpoIIE family protein phosphatase [Actinomycetota bacterium]